MFTTFVLQWNHPAGVFSPTKTPFPEILDMVTFQKMSFRQKLCFPDYWENELILWELLSQIIPFLDPYPEPFSDPLKD